MNAESTLKSREEGGGGREEGGRVGGITQRDGCTNIFRPTFILLCQIICINIRQ